ncbi:cobalt-precorrin-6A reductase [Nocardia panacis]|uniref:Cobalt-precorrin-6A reductase n=1 Tax=Nocardia panacis TaxID=2340916 RepID=A0A3A4K932_9NOCA|nr:cobalt-precorrin-6A reductase [Nocardia panacis]RJO68438.1 cobalt-precorrin-6A reductase [Nocardia panacis]
MVKVLLLGGTGEARELAAMAERASGFEIISALAGRTTAPRLPSGAVRIGGFGGSAGLREWLVANEIEAVVDATHPFAATISAHAATAAAALGLPLLHLRRPGWVSVAGDHWIRVPDRLAAVRALRDQGERIFLTIGRQGVADFAELTGWFLIRAIDPPTGPLPARHELLLARGPFTVADEAALLARRRIDAVVTKDSGGAATEAKLIAARAAGITVVLIDRPALPEGARVVSDAKQAWEWLCSGAFEHLG